MIWGDGEKEEQCQDLAESSPRPSRNLGLTFVFTLVSSQEPGRRGAG